MMTELRGNTFARITPETQAIIHRIKALALLKGLAKENTEQLMARLVDQEWERVQRLPQSSGQIPT